MPDFLGRILADVAGCSGCGQCLQSCPAYNATGKETDGPAAKIALLEALGRKQLEPRDLVKSFASCTLCGRCESACPASLPLKAVFLQARQYLAKLLPVTAKRKLAARVVAMSPRALDLLQPPLALAFRRNQSRLAFLPFRAKKAAGAKENVLFYPGCLTARFLPELGRVCKNLLSSRGFSVSIARDLPCCGRPLAMQGQKIAPLVRRFLKKLAKLDFAWFVTACPGCLDSFLHLWPSVPDLEQVEKEALAHLASRALDINAFLAASGATARPDLPADIFWHRPCLLPEDANTAVCALIRPVQGDSGQPLCCGASLACLDLPARRGLLQKQDRLGARLAKAIRSEAASASIIVTACPGCILALAKETDLPVRHALEFYQ